MNERRRRHTFPVRHHIPYSHSLYIREIYKSYILNELNEDEQIEPYEQSEPYEQNEQSEQSEPTKKTKQPRRASDPERPYFGGPYYEEPYSYASLSSNPDLCPPYKSATISSAYELPRPLSKNGQNKSRNTYPNFGIDITNNFLFSDKL